MQAIASALVKAQKDFSPALKCATNPHFKSKYADLAACLEAVQDPLNNNGIALLQVTHEDLTGVTVETLFIHESGEQISGGKLHVPASKQDPQGYGSALTYARRYSLLAACGIAPEDDDGNAASKAKKPDSQAPSKPASVAKSEFDGLGADEQSWIRNLAMSPLALLHKDDVAGAVNELEVIKENELEGDATLFTALWSLFDSKQRAAIKKFKQEQKDDVGQ